MMNDGLLLNQDAIIMENVAHTQVPARIAYLRRSFAGRIAKVRPVYAADEIRASIENYNESSSNVREIAQDFRALSVPLPKRATDLQGDAVRRIEFYERLLPDSVTAGTQVVMLEAERDKLISEAERCSTVFELKQTALRRDATYWCQTTSSSRDHSKWFVSPMFNLHRARIRSSCAYYFADANLAMMFKTKFG